MLQILAALAPIFLLILFGYFLRKSGLFGGAFWAEMDRLVFFVLFPAFLVYRIGTADLGGLALWPMSAGLLIGLAAIAALTFAIRPLLRAEGPAFAAIFQGTMRPNTYVAFAAAEALFGVTGGVLAAIAVAVSTPLVNVFAAVVLTRYGSGGGSGWRTALLAIARNPIILSVAAGLAVNLSGLGLPPVVDGLLEILASATLPMALLSVGAGLQFRAARQAGGTVLATSALKLLVLPMLTLGACLALGAEGLPLTVAVMFAGLPNSPTSYAMTRQLGGDHTMMASLITVQTFLAFATLPAILVLMERFAG